MNFSCLFGHKIKYRIKVRNQVWGKPMGEPRFYFKCERCGLKDTVDLPWHTTGNSESERWDKPISKLGRKFGRGTMSKLNKYDGSYFGYHGRGMYFSERKIGKLAKILAF